MFSMDERVDSIRLISSAIFSSTVIILSCFDILITHGYLARAFKKLMIKISVSLIKTLNYLGGS